MEEGVDRAEAAKEHSVGRLVLYEIFYGVKDNAAIVIDGELII